EAGQTGVAGAQVVDRDAKAQGAQGGDARTHVFDVVERGALGDFENDAVGDLRERRIGGQQRLVEQVLGVQVQKHASGGQLAGATLASSPARSPTSLPCVPTSAAASRLMRAMRRSCTARPTTSSRISSGTGFMR